MGTFICILLIVAIAGLIAYEVISIVKAIKKRRLSKKVKDNLAEQRERSESSNQND